MSFLQLNAEMADDDSWKSARTLFVKDLSTKKRKFFETSTLDNLLEDTIAAQKKHENNSRLRHISKKLKPFVSAIDQYDRALDMFFNIYSIATALLWRSIKVLLHVWSRSLAFNSFFFTILH